MTKQKTLIIGLSILLVIAAFTSAVFIIIPIKSGDSDLDKTALVDINAYEELVPEVKKHREERLVDLDTFLEMSKEEDVIILDARSNKMYDSKHLKGAVNLNFSDFTQANLEAIIPSKDTKILIYCNNNFENDLINFATKSYVPSPMERDKKPITLALNIPTYINLYGYGYRNIYELSELVSVNDSRLEFEGTAVQN